MTYFFFFFLETTIPVTAPAIASTSTAAARITYGSLIGNVCGMTSLLRTSRYDLS
jgi:hypothetical protein